MKTSTPIRSLFSSLLACLSLVLVLLPLSKVSGQLVLTPPAPNEYGGTAAADGGADLIEEEATATLHAIVQLCEKHQIQNIRISGGKDVFNPHGRLNSSPEERGLDLVNDEWLMNGPQPFEGEPAILSLNPRVE